jgi:hypothetical protein
MKRVLVPIALASLFALAACDKPAVVAVPAPSPAPVAVPVPVPGPAGPQGEAGKPGQTNVIVAPAASAASN